MEKNYKLLLGLLLILYCVNVIRSELTDCKPGESCQEDSKVQEYILSLDDILNSNIKNNILKREAPVARRKKASKSKKRKAQPTPQRGPPQRGPPQQELPQRRPPQRVSREGREMKKPVTPRRRTGQRQKGGETRLQGRREQQGGPVRGASLPRRHQIVRGRRSRAGPLRRGARKRTLPEAGNEALEEEEEKEVEAETETEAEEAVESKVKPAAVKGSGLTYYYYDYPIGGPAPYYYGGYYYYDC